VSPHPFVVLTPTSAFVVSLFNLLYALVLVTLDFITT